MKRPYAVLVVAGVLAAGCTADQGTENAGATGSATASPSPAAPSSGGPGGPAVTGEPPFPADAEPDASDGGPVAGGGLTVSDVRVAAQDGFDRVVFEFGGTGEPSWDVRYAEQATSQGSGEVVDVPGAEVLQVTLGGVGYPYETGVTEWSGPEPLTAPDTGRVAGVVFDATFEGLSTAFVGTSARAPFRVFTLTGPTRVVVDVADAG
ncbi:hypothetical protein GB931_12205 [Modestobacter sp. I12A-02628]|uniref:AMIN-like domain-containing protein n=1 Tax=Goekera deserti TaxID=2497753 RepID=A0A7K3WAC2_9ACTN|nr:hypothetical protein [Goekera deserti]MPQ98669.1 hypothetical protein [Goekera deserti]NDI49231.1 hypothetical protein [Goekera deserti]NEL52969.1 hypothetical protein [Goekera deserti]